MVPAITWFKHTLLSRVKLLELKICFYLHGWLCISVTSVNRFLVLPFVVSSVAPLKASQLRTY